MKRCAYQRKGNGSIATLAFVAMVPLVGAIAGLAVDCMHNNDAIGGLQRATDAAAMAGAYATPECLGVLADTAQVTGPGNEPAVNAALLVAGLNIVDGRQVKTDMAGDVTVTATIGPVGYGGNPVVYTKVYPTCTVDATMNIHSLFGMLFGNYGQTISTHSVASAGDNIDTVPPNCIYPMALGFNDLQPTAGLSLSALKEFKSYSWSFTKNAAWTDVTTSAAAAVNAAQVAYITPGAPGVAGSGWNTGGAGGSPATAVGQSATCFSGTMLSSETALAALPSGTVLLIPIVDSTASSGTYTIRGFVELSYAGYDGTLGKDAVFTGYLNKLIGPGINTGIGLGAYATWLNNLGPKSVQLTQ